jgi:hypothetical protein
MVRHSDRRALRSRTITVVLFILLVAAGLFAQSTSGGSYFLFPRFVAWDPVDSGIAIFNPGPNDAIVTLTLVDSRGAVISGGSQTILIPASGQVAKTASDVFGAGLIDASLIVSSPIPGLIAYYQTFNAAGTYSDGTDQPLPGTTLIFPVVPGPAEGYAELDLINPNPRATSVELNLWGIGGELLGKGSVQVPAYGFYRGLASDNFPSSTNFAGASHITAVTKPLNIFAQAQSVAGTSLLLGFSSVPDPYGRVDLAALNALPLTQAANGGGIPHFKTGSHDASILSVANLEAASADVTVTAIANNGSTVASRKVSLKANGGVRASLRDFLSIGGESEGWLLVQSTGRVSASLIFGKSDNGSLSAAPMQKSPAYEFLFPQLVEGSAGTTQISFANPTPNTSYADVYVIKADGITSGYAQITVSPGAAFTGRIGEILPEVGDQVGGYIYVKANEPLFATCSIATMHGATVASFSPQALTSYFKPAPLTSFAITGKVTLNDAPVPGFKVVVSGPVSRVATTNADGFYAFTGLPAGRYTLLVDQYGFQFVPQQASFEITNGSKRQNFQGYTAPDAIVVQPASLPVESPDTAVTIIGGNFDSSSQAYTGTVRLDTTFVDNNHLQVVIPAYLLAVPQRFDITVVTGTRVSSAFPFVAYEDQPVLLGISGTGVFVEGNSATTLTLIGEGFLPGAVVKVNGQSDGIRTQVIGSTKIVVDLPAQYFAHGGIYPVTVLNPYPANIESNVQLLTVYYPAPAVEGMSPNFTSARLEPGSGTLNIEIYGWGFRRGAVVYFNNQALATTYCETNAYCMAVHLYAKVPPELLAKSGFARVWVQNPDPSLASSEAVFFRVEGLQPTVTSVIPGSATALDLPGKFTMPVVVNGTNFGPQTLMRIYQTGTYPLPEFGAPAGMQVLSSTQLYVMLDVTFASLGEWTVEIANPQPGGGQSEPLTFYITEGNFVANPFLISMTPEAVAAGGSAFTLVVNGSNFQRGAQVRFYSTMLQTTFVSDHQLRAEVPASMIQNAGRVPVSVTNPDNGGTSNRLYMDIR